MAETTWNSSLSIERWSKEFFRQASVPEFMKRFMGKSAQNIFQEKTELKKSKGDKIHFGLIMKLVGSGVTGDNTMAGNDEDLVTYEFNATIDQLRNSVLSKGKVNDKRTTLDFRKEALDALKIWFGEQLDSDMFSVLSASPTRTLGADSGGTPRINSAAKSGLVSGDVIDLADISLLKTLAVRPKGSDQVKIRPIKVDGKSYYVYIMGPESAREIKDPGSEWSQAQREAAARGKDNPVFSGALGIYDGVILHTHENISSFDDGGGASVHGEQNLFLGAQAGVFAYGGDYTWHEETVDRGNKLAVTGGLIYEAAKTKFNSEDFACISHYVATTDLT